MRFIMGESSISQGPENQDLQIEPTSNLLGERDSVDETLKY